MAEDRDQSSDAQPIKSDLAAILRDLRSGNTLLLEQHERLLNAQNETVAKLDSFRSLVEGELKSFTAAQDKLRAILLEKQDHLQGTMDLLRIDLRSNWNTADFAILNSRGVREEQDKMLDMISTMQKQQQLLAAQVEELRKNALDRGQSGS